MTGGLLAAYDAVLLDLDGTVYRGGGAVPGAEQAVAGAKRDGVAVRFVTNNASRSPEDVAEHLTRLGIPAEPADVTTSAQAGARMTADRVPSGGAVLIVGTDALAAEISGRGLRPVREAGDGGVAAVVQGLSQDVGYRDLAEACLAIRAGALWIACNIDATLPTERGLLPGNGALVAALRAATDVEPLVAGKPARPLMDDSIAASGSSRPLVVGDRLDTDIAGASAVDADALLVLTGVSTAADLLAAPARLRPRYVDADLGALARPPAEVAIGSREEWSIEAADDGLTARFTGSGTPDPLNLLRALCAAWWPHNSGTPHITAADPATTKALHHLNLP